jgi:hypothetical protein
VIGHKHRRTVVLRGALVSRSLLRQRLRECESVLDYAVDIGWADELVRALEVIAKGATDARELARMVLQTGHLNREYRAGSGREAEAIAPWAAQMRLFQEVTE